MEIEPKFGFHGMITEVDLLHSRIAELEDQETDFREYLVKYFDIQQFDLYAENERLKRGPCRFNCRTQKEAFMAGWRRCSKCHWDDDYIMHDEAYKQWAKERAEQD